MQQGTVSLRYSSRCTTDGYAVAAIAADGQVLEVLDRLLSHGYAVCQANRMAETYGLPMVDHTQTEPAPLTSLQEWQSTVYRLND